MNCPAPARLAAAATGEDLGVLDHARGCLACRAALIEQGEVIRAARMLKHPSLAADRRAALAAEVMARADVADAQRPWRGERVMAIAASVVAAAAVVTIVLASGGPRPQIPAAPQIAADEEPAVHTSRPTHLDVVAAPLRANVVGTGAELSRALHGEQDVVTLREGEVSVDATDREPVTIVAGDTRVVIASSRAKVVARRGVIVTAQVFAGTAQVTSGGRQQVIDAGDVWMHAPEPKPAV
ncbi:MAG TPA: hypothetical protein VFV99_26940, partial [Kofleriaceae bacterium]|nr:hypothetical protein [Kofleriaceae bacterium]